MFLPALCVKPSKIVCLSVHCQYETGRAGQPRVKKAEAQARLISTFRTSTEERAKLMQCDCLAIPKNLIISRGLFSLKPVSWCEEKWRHRQALPFHERLDKSARPRSHAGELVGARLSPGRASRRVCRHPAGRLPRPLGDSRYIKLAVARKYCWERKASTPPAVCDALMPRYAAGLRL